MNAPKEDKKDVEAITIHSFSKSPSEIDGCSCYFSSTEKAFKQRQYILATNLSPGSCPHEPRKSS